MRVSSAVKHNCFDLGTFTIFRSYVTDYSYMQNKAILNGNCSFATHYRESKMKGRRRPPPSKNYPNSYWILLDCRAGSCDDVLCFSSSRAPGWAASYFVRYMCSVLQNRMVKFVYSLVMLYSEYSYGRQESFPKSFFPLKTPSTFNLWVSHFSMGKWAKEVIGPLSLHWSLFLGLNTS